MGTPHNPGAAGAEGGLRAELDAAVAGLREARRAWREAHGRLGEPAARELPSREVLALAAERLRGALFPMRLGPPDLRPDTEDYFVGHALSQVLVTLREQALLELRHAEPAAPLAALQQRADAQVREFARALPGLRRLLDSDVQAAFEGDPAARSVDEVLLCYPGLRAMIHHRVAHALYSLGLPLLARVISEIAHGETGIDIHPGASIGAGCFIDHGTGVVIGETARLGRRVRLYQNVTLGAKRFEVGSDGALVKGQPRHPVVEDDVVIYAGATVLGRVTIGRGAVIGGNVWLTRSVPAGAHITQADATQANATQANPIQPGAGVPPPPAYGFSSSHHESE